MHCPVGIETPPDEQAVKQQEQGPEDDKRNIQALHPFYKPCLQFRQRSRPLVEITGNKEEQRNVEQEDELCEQAVPVSMANHHKDYAQALGD